MPSICFSGECETQKSISFHESLYFAAIIVEKLMGPYPQLPPNICLLDHKYNEFLTASSFARV